MHQINFLKKLLYEYWTQRNATKYLKIETLYEASSQGVGHNTMRALQKPPKDL
jgi:hypothetical protein